MIVGAPAATIDCVSTYSAPHLRECGQVWGISPQSLGQKLAIIPPDHDDAPEWMDWIVRMHSLTPDSMFNLLYYGDNLDVPRLHVKDESVDPSQRRSSVPRRCLPSCISSSVVLACGGGSTSPQWFLTADEINGVRDFYFTVAARCGALGNAVVPARLAFEGNAELRNTVSGRNSDPSRTPDRWPLIGTINFPHTDGRVALLHYCF